MPLVIGTHPTTPYGHAHTSLSAAKSDGLSYILLNLANEGPRADLKALQSSEWGNSIVGVLSDFTQPSSAAGGGSPPGTNKTLESEVEWAMHMGIPAVSFPPCPPLGGPPGSPEAHANFNRMLHATALKVSGSR